MAADCYQDREASVAVGQSVRAAGTAVLVPAPATTLVAGMGGVGKTQIAAEYARSRWTDPQVDLVLWVSATSRDSILTAYADTAQRVGCATGQNPEAAARALLAWLAGTPRRWLIALDDLQDPDDLAGLWPPHTGSGQTVVTTRRRDAALERADRRMIEVGVFSPPESVAYLTAKLATRQRLLAGAAELAEELGHLPVALAQAVAYLVDRGLTCTGYRQRFVNRRETTPDRLPDDHQRTLDATWSLSIELADHLQPAGLARPLLELASLLNPNGIPIILVTTEPVLTFLSNRLGRTVDPDDARDALRCLHRLSLVTLDTENPERGIRVHALVQRATRNSCAPPHTAGLARVAADALLASWPKVERDTALAEILRTNATTLRSHTEDHLWRPNAHAVLFRVGRSLGEAGLVHSAIGYFEQLHATAQEKLSQDHPDTLTTRHNLARWRGEAGDIAGAITELEHLLTDYLRVLGPDHPATLTTRHSLAHWRGEAGDATGAVTELEQVLTDEQWALGADHPQTLTTRGELAHWRGEAGDPAGAITELEHLLTDYLRVLGPDHPATLRTRHNLARWRGEAGDPAGAITELEHLLTDRLRVLGPDHPATLRTRNNLAYRRGQAGDMTRAVTELEHLLTDRLRVLGPDHPHTLATRGNLAYWRGEAGDTCAVTELEHLLTDQQRVLGPDHPHTLTTRHNLAHWQGKAGDIAGAVTELEQVLADRQRVLGLDHPDTLTTRSHLETWKRELRSGDDSG